MNADPHQRAAPVGPDSSGRSSQGREAAEQFAVIPAEAGIQCSPCIAARPFWIPACAGMTRIGSLWHGHSPPVPWLRLGSFAW